MTLKWTSCQCEGFGVGIGFQTAALVIYPDRKDPLDIFNFPEINLSKEKASQIKEEGIYFFGGKNEDGIVVNTLKILKIGIEKAKFLLT